MAANKILKEISEKYSVGDTFTNGDGHFIVSAVTQRDANNKLLKEPLYTLERFPDAIYIDNRKVLDLHPFDAYESEINRQITFNWSKVN